MNSNKDSKPNIHTGIQIYIQRRRVETAAIKEDTGHGK
jgi:hypothetical protein